MIATGFDRARSATAPGSQASVPTPVDLNAYALRAQEDRVAVNGGVGRVSLTRRRPVELPAAGPARVTSTSGDGARDVADDASPLDVPAFLRRQEG